MVSGNILLATDLNLWLTKSMNKKFRSRKGEKNDKNKII